MNNKILIAALACTSVIAGAQSNMSNTQEQAKEKAASTTQTTPARDMATGQMSGKRANAAPSGSVKAPRDLATGQASGRESSAASVSEIVVTKKTTAQDDWQTPAKKESGGVRVAPADLDGDGKADRVAKGDVNGDGKADVAATSSQNNQKAAENSTSSNAQPKSAATGQAGEKRQHSPVTFQKEVGPTSPSK